MYVMSAFAVVWTKENPTPWNDIKPNEGTKMLTVNQHFDKRYVPSAIRLT